jgi:hypothetical protein
MRMLLPQQLQVSIALTLRVKAVPCLCLLHDLSKFLLRKVRLEFERRFAETRPGSGIEGSEESRWHYTFPLVQDLRVVLWAL